jgi:phage terminase large subunit-like protein
MSIAERVMSGYLQPYPPIFITALVRDPICVVTRGSSYGNRGNLAPAFFDQIIRKYKGTRLGRYPPT